MSMTAVSSAKAYAYSSIGMSQIGRRPLVSSGR